MLLSFPITHLTQKALASCNFETPESPEDISARVSVDSNKATAPVGPRAWQRVPSPNWAHSVPFWSVSKRGSGIVLSERGTDGSRTPVPED